MGEGNIFSLFTLAGGGVPNPDLGWGGTTWPGLDGGGGTPHPLEQHSEHLLRGRRYASCVHAGGLSCSLLLLLHFPPATIGGSRIPRGTGWRVALIFFFFLPKLPKDPKTLKEIWILLCK